MSHDDKINYLIDELRKEVSAAHTNLFVAADLSNKRTVGAMIGRTDNVAAMVAAVIENFCGDADEVDVRIMTAMLIHLAMSITGIKFQDGEGERRDTPCKPN